MRATLAALVTLATLAALAPTTARADADGTVLGPCAPRRVGCDDGITGRAARADDRPLSRRTHTFLMPTGELVPAGRVDVSTLGLGAYNSLAIGVTDHLEVGASAPIIPFFVQVGARVGLAPKSSPLRVVVGASALIPADGDGDGHRIPVYTGTVAYRTARWNLHGTISAMNPGEGDGGSLGVLTGGVTWKRGPSAALVLDVVRVSTLGLFGAVCAEDAGDGKGGEGGGCGPDFSAATLVTAGVKLMGRSLDADLGLVFLVDDRRVEGAVPMVSMTYRL